MTAATIFSALPATTHSSAARAVIPWMAESVPTILTGGDGDDLYMQDSALDIIAESGATLNDELRTNPVALRRFAGIEHYNFLGGKAVDFTADGQNNRISGTKLADTLTGLGGDDTLNGGAGADSLSGGEGDDVYVSRQQARPDQRYRRRRPRGKRHRLYTGRRNSRT